MIVVGIDLSGPANYKDTSLTAFKEINGKLKQIDQIEGADDNVIYRFIKILSTKDRIIAGIDAPLSYNNGGGDRPSDKELREVLVSKGLKSGSVMTPTMTRMAYLTLRGISVARLIKGINSEIDIAEVHPGGAMILRGAEKEDVKVFKSDMKSRKKLLKWMESKGMKNLTSQEITDHYVASCGCALSAYGWATGKHKWVFRSVPHFHPFDFVC